MSVATARFARLVLGGWLAAGVVLSPALARAQTPTKAPAERIDQARETFRRGVAAYKQGDYRAALAAFRRSYELSANAQVLFNLGEAHWQLRDYGEAMNSFVRYLERGESIAPARRAALERRIAEIRERVGRVGVLAPEGAALTLDDTPLGPAPLASPYYVSAGPHKFAASPGTTRAVDVVGGDELEVDLRPAAAPPPPPPPAPASTPAPAPAQPAPSPPSNTLVWGVTAAAAVLGVGAAVTGAIAIDSKHDYDHALETFPVERDKVDSARSRTRAFGLTADILGAATIGTGAFAAYLWLSRPRPAPNTTGWGVGLVGSGLAVQGRF